MEKDNFVQRQQAEAREFLCKCTYLLEDTDKFMNTLTDTIIKNTIEECEKRMPREQKVPPVTADEVYHGDCIGHNSYRQQMLEVFNSLKE